MQDTNNARQLVAELRWLDQESRGALGNPMLMRRQEMNAESLMAFSKRTGALVAA